MRKPTELFVRRNNLISNEMKQDRRIKRKIAKIKKNYLLFKTDGMR